MKKLYLGCSLTHATEEFKKQISDLKNLLRDKYQIMEFLGTETGDARDVFKHDISQLKTCDLLLAECSHPSTGLGFEIATALDHHKPVLAVAQEGAKVSRLILGINSILFSFMRYQTLDEVLDAVEKKLSGII